MGDNDKNKVKKVSFALERNQIKIQSDHDMTDENEPEDEEEDVNININDNTDDNIDQIEEIKPDPIDITKDDNNNNDDNDKFIESKPKPKEVIDITFQQCHPGISSLGTLGCT